jgi:hypothetical protein
VRQRFLLPRISQTLTARHKLILLQNDLFSQFKSRLETFKKAQQVTFDALPPPQPEVFPPDIKSLEDISVDADGIPSQPLGIILRAAFLGEPGQKSTLDELHTRLLNLFPALAGPDGGGFKVCLSRYFKFSPGNKRLLSVLYIVNSRDPACLSKYPKVDLNTGPFVWTHTPTGPLLDLQYLRLKLFLIRLHEHVELAGRISTLSNLLPTLLHSSQRRPLIYMALVLASDIRSPMEVIYSSHKMMLGGKFAL